MFSISRYVWRSSPADNAANDHKTEAKGILFLLAACRSRLRSQHVLYHSGKVIAVVLMLSTAHEGPGLSSDNMLPASPHLAEFSSLPPEILALVFHFLVLSHRTYAPASYSDNRRQCDPPMTWIPSLLHTCSQWRTISIASPQLWSFIWVGPSEALTLQMLEWSGNEPLRVYCPELPHARDAKSCGSMEGPCGGQAAALERVIQGTRTILSMHLWGLTHTSSPSLFPQLLGLEELYLATTMMNWHWSVTGSLNDFLKRHGELRALTMVSFRPYTSQTISAQVLPATLTRLVLWNVNRWTDSTWAWLQNLPQLELLLLEDGSNPPSILPSLRFYLPALRKLHLRHMDTKVLHNLLHLLDIPKCMQFNLHTRHSLFSPPTDEDFPGLAQQLKRFAGQLEMRGGIEYHAHTSLSDYLVKITVCRKFDGGEVSIFSVNFRVGDIERPAREYNLPALWESMSSFPLKYTDSMTDVSVVPPNNTLSSSGEEKGTVEN